MLTARWSEVLGADLDCRISAVATSPVIISGHDVQCFRGVEKWLHAGPIRGRDVRNGSKTVPIARPTLLSKPMRGTNTPAAVPLTWNRRAAPSEYRTADRQPFSPPSERQVWPEKSMRSTDLPWATSAVVTIPGGNRPCSTSPGVDANLAASVAGLSKAPT